MKLSSLIRDLSSPVPEVHTRAREALENFFLETDVDLPDKNVRYLVRKLQLMDNPRARRVLTVYEKVRNKPLRFEEELQQYVASSRIEEKEFYEAKQFFQKVSPLFPDVETVVDCCSGNGLAGLLWGLEGKAKRVVLVDIERNSNFSPLLQWIHEHLEFPLQYIILDIEKERIPKGDILMAVHACGSLTDRIIEEGISQRVPLAVMPCCYKESTYLPQSSLPYFQNKRDAIDAARVMAVRSQGYEVVLRNIDPKVTPMNRIIVGTLA